MTIKLVLVRHGQSEWNKKNLFTGWKDVDLTELGLDEANRAGDALKVADIKFDIAFTSKLKRAQKTLNIILDKIGQSDMKTIKHLALNERDYGDLTGMNKDNAREKFGEEQVHIWRRSYDVPPPGGESLELTAKRVLPYFESEIEPIITAGKNVIIAAHGNSLRSLAMKIENLTKEEVLSLEIATGVPIIYDLDENLNILSKNILEI